MKTKASNGDVAEWPMRAIRNSFLLLLAASCVVHATAADTAEIRRVKVAAEGNNIKLEVALTRPVTPIVTIATNPNRLVLDLPTTRTASRQRRIEVNRNGVKRVRLGLNSSNPLVTRAVIDLDAAHPYQLARTGNSVILIVLPATADRALPLGAQPAARSSLWSKLWPRRGLPTATAQVPRKDDTRQPSDPNLHASFRVKYVADGAVYLNGGRSSGLAQGMKLFVLDSGHSPNNSDNRESPVVAELQIVSVAETSSVTEIKNAKRDVKPGDWAELSPTDFARLGEGGNAEAALHVPAQPVVTATPSKLTRVEQVPEQSQIRARIGLDYIGISSAGSTLGSSGSLGLSFQTDTTRIAGTHWNLQGYWRGRLTTNSQPDENTMENYLDRTYIIQLFYDNPDSKWVAGVGRLYLPWAASLDTIDGGYLGRKLAPHVTAGAFFGSTPDPTSWHYRPDQQIGGMFVNFEGGSYDKLHYSSTSGFALSMLHWQLDRPYLFLENAFSYSKFLSVYHSLILDSPQGVSTDGITPGTGISRSYLSVLVHPKEWISVEVFHNYIRDVPTAATALVGTGLVDKLLYQGVNGSVRIQPGPHFVFYTTLGQSDKTGDVNRSLNQMFGVTWKDVMRTGMRADVHYSKFDSSFAHGIYRILSLSRPLSNRVMWDVQLGSQTLASPFTVNRHSMFVDSSFDTNLGPHTFLQSGYTIERGAQLNYSQWHLGLGYRFAMKSSSQ